MKHFDTNQRLNLNLTLIGPQKMLGSRTPVLASIVNPPPPTRTIDNAVVKVVPANCFPHLLAISPDLHLIVQRVIDLGRNVGWVGFWKSRELCGIVCSPSNPNQIVCASYASPG